VLVHSLSLDEFNDGTVQNLLSQDSCEEVKVHFVRPKDRPNDWSGYILSHTTFLCGSFGCPDRLHYGSCPFVCPVRAPYWKRKGVVEKPKVVLTFLGAGVTGVPICCSVGHGLGLWLGLHPAVYS